MKKIKIKLAYLVDVFKYLEHCENKLLFKNPHINDKILSHIMGEMRIKLFKKIVLLGAHGIYFNQKKEILIKFSIVERLVLSIVFQRFAISEHLRNFEFQIINGL